MSLILQSVFILLVLLQLKHMFADYFLQTPRMLAGRSIYLHWGRVQHAGLHAVFSLAVFAIIGMPFWLNLLLCFAEWVVHFHIDFGKARYSEKKAHGPADAGFWRAFGFDQLLHQLTYIAMIWFWAVFAA